MCHIYHRVIRWITKFKVRTNDQSKIYKPSLNVWTFRLYNNIMYMCIIYNIYLHISTYITWIFIRRLGVVFGLHSKWQVRNILVLSIYIVTVLYWLIQYNIIRNDFSYISLYIYIINLYIINFMDFNDMFDKL